MKTEVRDSSLEAHEALKLAGLQRRQQQVLSAIQLLVRTGQSREGWVSRRQISRVSGMETSCVAGRVNAMVGTLLEETANTHPCPVTGRAVHLVRIRVLESAA